MSSQQFKKKPGAKKKARDEFDEDEIFQAPVITRDPTSRQAKLGGKVVLRIQATGKPLPSFQWFHNGKKISGANTDRLTLSKIRRMAAGAYHCEAKNFVGKAVSRVAMLSFMTQRVPKLVIGPEVQKIEEGKPFTVKVISPAAAELKDFKIYWIFNGMRIKGAVGPELNISAAKKKYEGEYKAMIATGGSLETSNVAKMSLKPAGVVEAARELPGEALQVLPPEAPAASPSPPPSECSLVFEVATKAEAPAPPAKVSNWEDFLFNPEEEESSETDASLVAPAPGSESYGNTSPGTPGAPKPPISQLATQDLIREVAARGGVSELIEEVSREDPSALILAAESGASEITDPSALLGEADASPEPPAKPIGRPAPVARLVPAPAPPPVAAEVPEEETDNLIQDWGIEPSRPPQLAPIPIRAVPAKPGPSPKLIRKKEFLENLLGRWQARVGKKSARAA